MLTYEPVILEGQSSRTLRFEGNWDALSLLIKRAKEQGLKVKIDGLGLTCSITLTLEDQ